MLRSLKLDPALEDRILALDPDHISDYDVRSTLAAGPTPRIILVHASVYPVYLIMSSFATFLEGMGYPGEKLRDPVQRRVLAESLWQQRAACRRDRLVLRA